MKKVNQVLGLHESSNHLNRVIKEVSMPDPRIYGYIDENKTIFINKDLSRKNKSLTIRHENGHKRQMEEGRLKFDSLKYEWKNKPHGKTFVYPTKSIDTRSRILPWEKEVEEKYSVKRNIKRKL